MNTTQRWPLIVTTLLLTLISSGCGTTQPSKFYMLNASSTAPHNSNTTLNIGLGPIELPAYLDRSKIMVRTSHNSYKAAEYHRWAEPLTTNFSRVLSQELSNALPQATITTYPWRTGKKIDTQLQLEVLSFDSNDNKEAQLTVRWELLDADKKTVAPSQQRQYLKRAHSNTYEARVAAMSECVTALGQELALEISRISP